MHHEFMRGMVADLSALAACTRLQTLDLEGCGMVADLSALAACTGLKELNLRGCTGVTDMNAWWPARVHRAAE